jgi:virginiamycin A acetyltransferase
VYSKKLVEAKRPERCKLSILKSSIKYKEYKHQHISHDIYMSLHLGTDTYHGDNVVVHYWHSVPHNESIVHVGNYCSIANGVEFFADGNHHIGHASSYPFYDKHQAPNSHKNAWGKGAPKVGHDVWIGTGAKILNGVSIGTGAVIGAFSVVTKDVPPYAVAAGNPASVRKYRFDHETIQALLRTQWWDLPRDAIFAHLVPVQNDVHAWIAKADSIRASSSSSQEEN